MSRMSAERYWSAREHVIALRRDLGYIAGSRHLDAITPGEMAALEEAARLVAEVREGLEAG